ncbi:MAG TPA: uroporphyrinogen-III synthase [Gammaproteobacteria bacterium]|jgi:uroporphyrinogen-III synthase|nr:uroporphyrinogen-III synthase [Gammaproteobacteria bacterium]
MTEPLCVLVTRPAGQAQGLCELIEAAGARAIRLPAIEILPPADPTGMDRAIVALDQYDLAVFISVNAVKSGLAAILSVRNWPDTLKLATVGPASAAAVAASGLTVDLHPAQSYSSEGLLELEGLQDMHGRRVVIFRGNGGRDILHDALKARGAQVEYVEVYRRVCPQDGGELVQLLRQGRLDVITATSNESLQNLYDMAGPEGQPLLRQLPLVIASNRQAALAARLGFSQGAVIAGHASDDAMFSAIQALAASLA